MTTLAAVAPHLQAQVNPLWAPASQVGHTDPLISNAKSFLRRFSYGKAVGLGTVDVDDTYTLGFGRALVTFKTNTRVLVERGLQPGPLTDFDSEFDWATKKQMHLLAPPPPVPVPGNKLKPVYFSVEGHMSDMFIGPAVEIGRRMEQEGLVQLQPVGYVNTAIPFQSNTGVDELVRMFLDPRLMPAGRKWCISGFSEGDIVVSRFMNRHVIPEFGMFHHRLVDMISILELGAPTRPADFLGDAMLQPDPPRAGMGGIAPKDQWLMVTALGNRIAYLVRTKDMYTEVPMDKAGELQRSVYSVVAESNITTIAMELLAAGINPTAEILNIAYAIIRGTLFLFDMRPHGGYDIEPAVNWVRGKIRVAVTA